MEKPEIDRDTVDWRPEWQGADLAEYNKCLGSLRSQIASFRELRHALGLSQAEAASRLVTSQSNVSKIEAKSDPSLSTLRKLLGVDGDLKVVAHLRDGSDLEIMID